MSRLRLAVIVLAMVVIALAWQQVLAARAGLSLRSLPAAVPAVFMAPKGSQARPAVLLAHGFSGSKQLMQAYAYTLAHAGYAVLLWDFDGHGANAAPAGADSLQANIETAFSLLAAQPEADPTRVALLGHSMGSGAVMTAGITHPDRYAAVIAISPTGADVSADRPPNLLLQAGAWEAPFVANARRLLTQAGGPNDNLTSGQARSLIVIPAAEHISILFRSLSHQAALDWLDGVFGPQGPHFYTDRRITWFLLHLVAWLALLVAVGPWIRRLDGQDVRPVASTGLGWRPWLGLALGPLTATLFLALLNYLTPVASLGGIQVGMAMGLWFGLAGLVWLVVGGLQPGRPQRRALALGLAMFVVLTLAFGVMAQTVWMQWWLIGPRMLRWPLLALLTLLWFLAAGVVQAGAERTSTWRATRLFAWWLAQSISLLAGLAMVVLLVPGMFFVFLLLPLVPLLVGILALAAMGFTRPWSYALGSALFFGWVLAAVFPLAA